MVMHLLHVLFGRFITQVVYSNANLWLHCSNADKIREFIKSVYVDKKYSGGKAFEKPPRDTQVRTKFLSYSFLYKQLILQSDVHSARTENIYLCSRITKSKQKTTGGRVHIIPTHRVRLTTTNTKRDSMGSNQLC